MLLEIIISRVITLYLQFTRRSDPVVDWLQGVNNCMFNLMLLWRLLLV